MNDTPDLDELIGTDLTPVDDPVLPRSGDGSWLPRGFEVTRPAPHKGSVTVGVPGVGFVLFEPTESGRLVATEAYDSQFTEHQIREGVSLPPEVSDLIAGVQAPTNALEAAGEPTEPSEEASDEEEGD